MPANLQKRSPAMKITGFETFILDNQDEWEDFPGPREVLKLTDYCGLRMRAEAGKCLLGFSARHNIWCGVEWFRLIDEVKRTYPSQWVFIKDAMENLIFDKLVEVKYLPGGWIKILSAKIICPTPELARVLMDKQL